MSLCPLEIRLYNQLLHDNNYQHYLRDTIKTFFSFVSPVHRCSRYSDKFFLRSDFLVVFGLPYKSSLTVLLDIVGRVTVVQLNYV